MSRSISLKSIEVTDLFWKQYMELVRKEVIPYQWRALNDQVEGAAKSYAMRNFKLAGEVVRKRKEQGEDSVPVFTTSIFETLPKDPDNMEDCFYGFLFQDSDFSKWIEAAAYSLTQHPDAELERIADGAIDIVCNAQMEDGYLDTFYIINDTSKRFTNLRDHHELYCFGHLTEGAVAYYQATGKDKLLNAAKRFADCIYERFGEEEEKCKGYPGHEIAEMALMRLFDLTKEDKYLKLAKFFVDVRGQKPYYYDMEHKITTRKPEDEAWQYQQAHRPVKEQEEAVGHAVRAVYLYSGMADVARETKDEGLLKACEILWENIVNKKMYITGGIGGTHVGEAFSFPYDLPNDTAYAETCASIGLVFFAGRMLNIKAKGEYGDVMERALYNGVLSGMALDGKSFFYVNPLEVLPKACVKDERKRHVKPIRQKWFGCACCPPNIARLVSSIAAYAYSVDEDTIYMHLFMGGRQTQNLSGRDICFNITSNYPWEESVKIEVSMEEACEFTYAVRVPGWCRGSAAKASSGSMCIQVNGQDAEYDLRDGYAYIKRIWQPGDVIGLNIPLKAKTYRSNKLVRENAGKLAVMRGPVVYCMEEVDNSKNLHLYKLKCDAEFREEYKEGLLGGVVTLTAEGVKAPDGDYENEGLYAEAEKESYDPALMTFVPYYAWNNRGEGEMQVWAAEA